MPDHGLYRVGGSRARGSKARRVAKAAATPTRVLSNGKPAAPVRSTVGDYAKLNKKPGLPVDESGSDFIRRLRSITGKNSKALNSADQVPGIMSPGSGLPTNSGLSAKAGKTPGLNINNSGAAKRAKNAAGIEFDPQINAIRNLIGSTQKSGNQNISDVGNSYKALEGSIRADIPTSNANYDATQAKVAEIYAKLKADTDARYGGMQAAQKTQLDSLGLQQSSLGPNAVQNKQTGDQAFLQGIIGTQGATAAATSEQQQLGASDFIQGNATRAAAQGVTDKTAIMRDLADKILKLKTDKGSLTASKSKSIRELTDQYTQEARANAENDRAFAADQQKFKYGVSMDNVNLQDKRLADAAANENQQASLAISASKAKTAAQAASQKQSQIDYSKLDPWERAGVKAAQLFGTTNKPDNNKGAKAVQYLQNLIARNPNIRNGFRPGPLDRNGIPTQIKMTAEQFGTVAANNAGATGLSKGSIAKIAAMYWKEMHG